MTTSLYKTSITLCLLFLVFLVGMYMLQLNQMSHSVYHGNSSLEHPLPPITEHGKLHENWHSAYNYINNNGKFCKYECPDGRTRYICGTPDGGWAIAVVDKLVTITAYMTNQKYARKLIDESGCSNPYRYNHP